MHFLPEVQGSLHKLSLTIFPTDLKSSHELSWFRVELKLGFLGANQPFDHYTRLVLQLCCSKSCKRFLTDMLVSHSLNE